MTTSVSRSLVRWARALSYERLPEEVRHEARRALVDALGCAIGGYNCDARRMAQSALRKLGGPQEATIIGNGERASCLTAAVVNGIMLRYLDYNDIQVYRFGKMVAGGHSSEVIPGALALAERNRVDGRELMTSIVIGYELSMGMLAACREMTFAAHGWNTDSRGAFVMPIVAGRLLGLNEDQTVNAVGISGSTGMILGILDTDEEQNTLAKNFRFPSATHRAMLSAFLAAEGFTGPERVFEGQRGFVQAAFQGDYRTDVLIDCGAGFRMLANRYKAFAAESTAQGHISCTLHLVGTHDLKPADIASVRVRAGSRAIAHTGDAGKRYPENKETADHSSWYLTAVAIVDRQVGPEQYSPARYSDPLVLSLMDRISLEVDTTLDPHPMGGDVEIRTVDGRSLSHRILHPKGTSENPLTDADLDRKFLDMAKVHLPGSRAEQLLEQLWRFDQLEDVSELMPLLEFP